MSERKLEPSPGWCERAYELLRDVQFYRYSPNEHDALMKRGTELMIQSDKAGVSDNEWRAAALDKMNARFKRYVENELKPDSPPQNFDGYCTGCLTRYVTSDSGGTCPVCGARVRPELKLAESDPHCLDDFRMPSDHEIISLWEKQIAEENQRSRDAGEQHPNIGEEFIQAVELARKYYNKAAQKPVPGRSGVVSGWDVPPSEGTEVDPRLQGIPKPAPLPHEVESIGKPICKHCGKYQYVSIYDGDSNTEPCPARNEPPAETTGVPWVDEALPPRETAEAPLPRIPFYLTAALHNAATADDAKTRERMLLLSVQYIFAECRKIAREEAVAAECRCRESFGESGEGLQNSMSQLRTDLLHEIDLTRKCFILSEEGVRNLARGQIKEARIEMLFGSCGEQRWCQSETLRIVPGKEGE